MEKNRETKENSQLEYQSVEEINLSEASEGDDYDIEVSVSGDLSKNEIENLARQELAKKYWWFDEYWREKGLPKEQIDIRVGEHNITFYNFHGLLTESQVDELKKSIEDFSQVLSGISLKEVQYFLVENERRMNPASGEEFYGQGAPARKFIMIYPRAIEGGSYDRIDKALSAFDATIIHELVHPLLDVNRKIVDKWQEEFGWEIVNLKDFKKMRVLPGGLKTIYENKYPERCVSNYATTDPYEDICESVVAALRKPELLDPEKIKFIQGKLLQSNKPLPVSLSRLKTVKMPKLKQDIKYKVEKGKLFGGRIVKHSL